MSGPRRKSDSEAAEAGGPQSSADRALALMIEALEMLDRDGGSNLAGAHLDLAIHRLRDWMGKDQDQIIG